MSKNNYPKKNNRYKNNNKNNYNKNNNNYNRQNSNTKQNKEKYVAVYSQKDYEKDKYDFNKSLAENNVNIKAFQRLVLSDIYQNSRIIETGKIGNYSLEEIRFAMSNKNIGWRTLLEVSDNLMRISPHYYRINSFYSNMPVYCWGIDLYDVSEKVNINTLKNAHNKLSSKLEQMELKHEFTKIMRKLPYQDIYCGIVVDDDKDFYFQEIDFRMCKIWEIQDGLWNFAINLSSIKASQLDAYPDYVKKAFIDYFENKNNGYTNIWYVPPADKQICIKFNTQWLYPYPLLINLIDDILNLDTYKKLKLQSARTDNYKAIMIKVPIDENTIDKPLLTPNTLATFAEMNRESMTDDIGIIHTLGSDGEVVSFKDSNNTRNNVADALDDIYNSSGISKEVFNGSASGTAVTYSIENDSAFIYSIYRQLERWVNRYIKLKDYNKATFKFSFYLLDVTIFNRKNVCDMYKDACSLSATVMDRWYAVLGLTPSKIKGSFVLHRDIFDFQNNLQVLQSSYNSSGSNDVGRPTNASQGKTLDVSGQKTQDSDANMDR